MDQKPILWKETESWAPIQLPDFWENLRISAQGANASCFNLCKLFFFRYLGKGFWQSLISILLPHRDVFIDVVISILT